MKQLEDKIAGILVVPLLMVAGLIGWTFGATGKRAPIAMLFGFIQLIVIGLPLVVISCTLFVCFKIIVWPITLFTGKSGNKQQPFHKK